MEIRPLPASAPRSGWKIEAFPSSWVNRGIFMSFIKKDIRLCLQNVLISDQAHMTIIA
jgi:hypothetical protein